MAENETSQWSQLPKDILTTISKRLNTTTSRLDTLRLRSVCKSWRSSIPPFTKTPPSSSFPLTLPFPISPNPSLNPHRRGHFSLSQSIIYFLQPPHHGGAGWLLRLEDSSSSNDNNTFHPLNPLSKIQTERVPWESFPNSLNLLNFRVSEIGTAYSLQFVDQTKKQIETTFPQLRSNFIKKVVVSDSNFEVMVIHRGKLGLFNLGDNKWSIPIDDNRYDDVVYHKGKFYAVDYRGRVVEIDSELNKSIEIVSSLPDNGFRYPGQYKNLVKSGDDLFLVGKYLDPENEIYYEKILQGYVELDEEIDPDDMPVRLRVFKLNDGKEWESVDSLNDRVFFIGDDCSYSVSARDFELKGNCIYFSDDRFTAVNEQVDNLEVLCGDTGVYTMEDDRCGPLVLFADHWPIFWPPPAWLNPKPPRDSKKK